MSTTTHLTPRAQDLSRFMRARHNIYLKRVQGWPAPWTDDPILQVGRFCNIFRELDTVTKWIDENIRKPYADHPHLWFMLCIARYINWPPTLAKLVGTEAWPDREDFSPEYMTACLEHIASTGEKVYTGAYMIRAESDPSKPWYSWTKHRYIAEIVLGRLWEDRELWAIRLEPEPCPGNPAHTLPALECVWNEFQAPRYVGWGPFMAYEVVTDLRHTRYLRTAPDIDTWANAGPGAIRGLNRLFGRDLNAQPKKAQTNREMFWYMKELNGDPALWPAKWPQLEMRDIEHSLCEFDKYERVRLGEGKMRSKYNWRIASNLSK
ncbi:alpha-glutamyl/putrescinyl thymine pyrophosphorylase [Stenotrophomonas phage Sonora]|nr:alpha-glutamyl/putrescinyl thymine pyrophosphorylase [Stenotrophomonas phage Sonora]